MPDHHDHISASLPPAKSGLVDNHGRAITYIRMAVTDRCNLRCVYCMPAEGIPVLQRGEIISLEELERLARLLVALGITKIRITGGEPFVRKGLTDFLERLRAIPGLQNLCLTTNGVATAPHLKRLQDLGIAGLNLSLDTLRPDRFQAITRRAGLDSVLATMDQALALAIPLKINAVIQQGMNDDEIVPLAELARQQPIEVRFIEQMPFSGGCSAAGAGWLAEAIIAHLKACYPAMTIADGVSGTARIITIPGFTGRVGIIGAYSRTFCGSCGKLRITPAGTLKTCLYDCGALDLRHLLRQGGSDRAIQAAVVACVAQRAPNGFAAEKLHGDKIKGSMASIGG
jgi:cyclic pyranopterin phosphate synthase